MKLKAYQGAFPATLVIVMVTFLSTIFFATVNPAYAASGKKKATTVEKTTAVEQTEARIKTLQGALKITEAQQASWNNLTLVMRENANEMDALAKERGEKFKSMNAVEHMKLHSQITEVQLNQLKKFIPPFEALYNSMSEEQQQIANALFRTGKHGKHKLM